MSKNWNEKKDMKNEDKRKGYSSSKNKNRRSRSNSRGKSKSGDSPIDKSTEQQYSNHPTWWNKTGQLAKDVSSFSFNNAIGSRELGFEKGRDYSTAAGIMRLDYVPNFGSVKGPADPINVAARLLYDVINSKNSRSPSYHAADLMVYVVAVANAWSYHAWLKRAIGLMLLYSKHNRYVPDGLLEAMGIAPISSQNDITAWRNVANRLMRSLNALAVPNGIDYFQRAIFMNAGIYRDSMTEKSSFMFFNPRAFLRLQELTEDKARPTSTLVYERLDVEKEGGLTVDDAEEIANNLVWPLFNSTAVSHMSSDIIKAYGRENCFQLPEITELETTVPVYDPVVLLQIHNARALRVDDAEMEQMLTKYTVSHDVANTNGLISTFPAQWSDAQLISATKSLRIPLDFPSDVVDNDMVFEATRLIYATNNPRGLVDPVCTEIFLTTKIFKYAEDSEGKWVLTSKYVCPTYVYTSAESGQMIDDFSDYIKFHSAPMFHAYCVSGAESHNQITQHRCLSDFTNYTTVADNELRNLHEAALLSVFDPLKK